ncbi:arylamine N-acetyltransferase [Stella sp.]|uniref:arylamine N-acetyltransferase family protein n=1 Tax=Stella sp. TaxID=2912054 RepID=UPI0035B3D4F7
MSPPPTHEETPALTPRQLDAYLARLGLSPPLDAGIETLTAIHRAHLRTFAWEALDAFMGWPSTVDPQDAFAKMVEGRRGGWCYEMNGLMGAALAALGFRVTRLCGAVERQRLGDGATGNHLTLQVDLDRPYLAEAGLADAIVEPVPMAVGPIRQRGFDFALVAPEDGWLRFENHPQGMARSFDFRPGGRDERSIAAAHRWLSGDPASPFTGSLALFRHTGEGYVSLHGDRLRRTTPGRADERQLRGADEFAAVLEAVFAVDLPRPREVWDKVMAARERTEAA